MGMIHIILAVIGVFAALVLFCAGVIWLEKRYPNEEYDERQKQAQGRASRLGMITGMLYYVAVSVILIQQVEKPKAVEPYLLVFIGIFLMVVVDNTYCFLTHSVLPLSSKPVSTIVCYGILGMVQLCYVAMDTKWIPLSWVGRGTGGWIHLLAGVSFLYLALMHLIRYLRDRKG